MLSTLLLSALAPAVWGTTYIVATELMPADRPLLTAAVRALPAGIALTAWTRQRPTGMWWWRTAVLGTLNIGGFFALLFVAAYRLPGGVAAMAGGVQPLVAAGLAAWLLRERFTTRIAVAGSCGILGVGFLVLRPEAALDPIGVVAALAGAGSMALGVVLTKRWGRPVGLLAATGWQLIAGGLLLGVLALIIEGQPPTFTGRHLLGTAWLTIVGTGIAYSLWFNGVERLPIQALAFLGLLSPLVATLLGWIVLDQTLDALQLGGAALIAVAVVLPQLRSHGRDTGRATSQPCAARQPSDRPETAPS